MTIVIVFCQYRFRCHYYCYYYHRCRYCYHYYFCYHHIVAITFTVIVNIAIIIIMVVTLGAVPPFEFLSEEEPEPHQAFKVAETQTSGIITA